MKIQYFSDLHLEFLKHIPIIQARVPILCLLGDIGYPFSNMYENFLIEQVSGSLRVIFVAIHTFNNKSMCVVCVIRIILLSFIIKLYFIIKIFFYFLRLCLLLIIVNNNVNDIRQFFIAKTIFIFFINDLLFLMNYFVIIHEADIYCAHKCIDFFIGS